jgi:hypothetical protein
MRFVEDTEKCEGDTRRSERDSWEIQGDPRNLWEIQ